MIDSVVLGLGGLCSLGFVVWLLGAGRWRNPLAGVEASGGGPVMVHALLVLGLYVGVVIVFSQALGLFVDVDSPREPGSHLWHLAFAADHAAELVVAGVMVWILSRSRSFRGAAGRLGVVRTLAVGVVGGLVVTLVCTLQLAMTKIIWQWLEPEHVPPVHVALLALKNSVWGGWGAVQLFVCATLVAPLGEELFFRGVVLQAVWRATERAWLAVVLSALLFGLVHFPQPQDVLPLCTMGVVQGYIRLRTRTLTVCVLVHALFNARTMLLAIFFPELIGEA